MKPLIVVVFCSAASWASAAERQHLPFCGTVPQTEPCEELPFIPLTSKTVRETKKVTENNAIWQAPFAVDVADKNCSSAKPPPPVPARRTEKPSAKPQSAPVSLKQRLDELNSVLNNKAEADDVTALRKEVKSLSEVLELASGAGGAVESVALRHIDLKLRILNRRVDALIPSEAHERPLVRPVTLGPSFGVTYLRSEDGTEVATYTAALRLNFLWLPSATLYAEGGLGAKVGWRNLTTQVGGGLNYHPPGWWRRLGIDVGGLVVFSGVDAGKLSAQQLWLVGHFGPTLKTTDRDIANGVTSLFVLNGVVGVEYDTDARLAYGVRASWVVEF